MKFLAFLFILYSWASLCEYVSHRWLMHSPVLGSKFKVLSWIYKDHMDHHRSFPAKQFSSSKAPGRFKGINLCVEHGFIFVIPLAALMTFWDPLLGLLSLAFVLLHFIAYNVLHSSMHLRTKVPFLPQWWKVLVYKNHFTHHAHPQRNFCVAFPGADYLFRTTAKLSRLDRLYWQRVRKSMETSKNDYSQSLAKVNGCLFSWKKSFRALTSIGVGKVTVIGELPSGPGIVAANHPNFKDINTIMAAFPNIRVMANDDVLRWVGWLLRPQGCFSHKGGISKAVELIKSGELVGICPEGWTNLTGAVRPFRRGVLVIAREANVPIIPVAITYGKYRGEWINSLPSPLQWILDLLLFRRVGATVIIGPSVKVEDLPGGDLQEKANSLRRMIIELAMDSDIN